MSLKAEDVRGMATGWQRRLPDDVWGERRKRIEDLVRSGKSMTHAITSVCGYVANHHLSARWPEWWAEVVAIRDQSLRHRIAMAEIGKRKKEQKDAAVQFASNQRVLAMHTLRGAGWTLQRIGDAFDITRERVRQLLAEDARRD